MNPCIGVQSGVMDVHGPAASRGLARFPYWHVRELVVRRIRVHIVLENDTSGSTRSARVTILDPREYPVPSRFWVSRHGVAVNVISPAEEGTDVVVLIRRAIVLD